MIVRTLDEHDHHVLRARTELRTVCVFGSPLTGREVHGPAGAYPPTPSEPQTAAGPAEQD